MRRYEVLLCVEPWGGVADEDVRSRVAYGERPTFPDDVAGYFDNDVRIPRARARLTLHNRTNRIFL